MSIQKKEAMKREQRQVLRKNLFWIALTVFFSISYLLWRIFRTFPYQKGVLSNVCWLILFLVEAVGLLEMVVHFYNMYDYGMDTVKKPARVLEYPSVDVFIPSLNEECALLSDTIDACKKMEYPQQSKVHIYLCDDGEREEAAKLCEEKGILYLGRTSHEDAKAGNLNYALSHSDSELVVVFDADMQPEQSFLMETVPYFCKAEKVGFVQTPQSFYEPDLFQWNLYAEDKIPNEQDYFYRVVQPSKNKSNSVVFGGSNAVLSRAALNAVGGFATGVLTEDFATGIELEKAGYVGISLNEILAKGKTPSKLPDLIRQRSRWARGCIQSGRKTKFITSGNLSFAQKINYFIGISYWYSPIKTMVYFLAPILFALFGIVVVECTLPEVLVFWVPMYLCSGICIRRFSHGIRSLKWTRLYDAVLCPYLLIPVLAETFGATKTEFVVTSKRDLPSIESDPGTGKLKSLICGIKNMIPYIVALITDLLAIYKIIYRMSVESTLSYIVVLLWLLINLHTIFLSIMAVWSRSGGYSGEKVLSSKLQESPGTGFFAFLSHILEG